MALAEYWEEASIQRSGTTAIDDPAQPGWANDTMVRDQTGVVSLGGEEPRTQESVPVVKEHAIHVGSSPNVTAGNVSEFSLGHAVHRYDGTKQPTGPNNLQITRNRIIEQGEHIKSATPREPSTHIKGLEDTRVRTTIQKQAINHAVYNNTDAPNTAATGQLSTSPISEQAVGGPEIPMQLERIDTSLHNTIDKATVTLLDSSLTIIGVPQDTENIREAYRRVGQSRTIAVYDSIPILGSAENNKVADTR